MKSSQHDKSSPLLWMIINQLDRLDTKISQLQKKNYVLNAKISVLETDFRKLKGSCENGWKSYGNNCYFFGINKINWHEAKKECEGRQSHLVKIDSSAESRWLGSEFYHTGITDDALWIGANDLMTEGKWTWISDHSTLAYSYWRKGEPNNNGGVEDCGQLYKQHSLTWNDAICSERHGYICEKW